MTFRNTPSPIVTKNTSALHQMTRIFSQVVNTSRQGPVPEVTIRPQRVTSGNAGVIMAVVSATMARHPAAPRWVGQLSPTSSSIS